MTSREIRHQVRAAARQASKLAIKKLASTASSISTETPRVPLAPPDAIHTAAVPSVSLHVLAHPDDDFDISPPNSPARPDLTERNRKNAHHSTGPRTVLGLVASSRNALSHGLFSGELIIPGEDAAAFDYLQDTLSREHAPKTHTEILLIREIAKSHWLVLRAVRLQNECFQSGDVDTKRLALFLRYQTTHERTFYRALTELRRLQNDRLKTASTKQSGFVSHTAAKSADAPGFVSQNEPVPIETEEEKLEDPLFERPAAA